jgi:hypothetical protein
MAHHLLLNSRCRLGPCSEWSVTHSDLTPTARVSPLCAWRPICAWQTVRTAAASWQHTSSPGVLAFAHRAFITLDAYHHVKKCVTGKTTVCCAAKAGR